jgi:putative oxidoreductase
MCYIGADHQILENPMRLHVRKTILGSEIGKQQMDIAILVLRVFIAVFMLTHGYGKMINFFSGEEVNFPDPLNVGPKVSLGLTAFAEFFCSIFVLLGFAMRLFLVPLIFAMGVVIFEVKWGDGFKGMELASLYLLTYVALFITGPGRLSVNGLLKGR